MTKSPDLSPENLKNLRGIVFDLDGTLVDSLATTFAAFNHGIVSLGGREHTPQEIMAHFGTGEAQIFAKIIGSEKAGKAYILARQFLDENLHRVPLHAGVPELLEKIKSADIPISIVTGRSWTTTEVILKHHGILDRFVTVIADDHVDRPKPAPDGIHLALRRMGLEPSEIFYVGDSAVDVMAARSAGSGSIAALWDLLAKREELEPHGPHHWAEHPGQVWELWEQNLS